MEIENLQKGIEYIRDASPDEAHKIAKELFKRYPNKMYHRIISNETNSKDITNSKR